LSLATRCFSCGTVFRVVQDQLKVSEGWVRCGQCNEVFNALETLFDLERDTPPEWSPPPPPEPTPSELDGPVDLELPNAAAGSPEEHAEQVHELEHELEHEHVEVDVRPRDLAAAPEAEHFDVPLVGKHHEASSTPAERVDERDRLEFPDARFDPESEPDAAAFGPVMAVHDTTLGPTPEADSVSPEFVLHAQRRARWNDPAIRIGLAVASAVLVIVLALQAVHQFRDLIAARWPDTQPALNAWCNAMGCTIQPPRHIDDLVVESTSLTRAEGTDAFKLAVTLRNHGTLALALPSIDLSLTDAGGQLVARRMLAPKEWRVGTSVIAAGADLPLQMLLGADSTRVTGYTVEVFYP
jgi:predicted Zn finger-like uncharacterized protein